MIPKKPQTVIKQVSEELDLPESMVDEIVSFYYKEIRKNLSSLEHIKINLPGLGDFIVHKKTVERLANKYEILKTRYNTDTFGNYHNMKQAESRHARLLHVKALIDEFIKKKKAFKDGRKNNGSVEE